MEQAQTPLLPSEIRYQNVIPDSILLTGQRGAVSTFAERLFTAINSLKLNSPVQNTTTLSEADLQSIAIIILKGHETASLEYIEYLLRSLEKNDRLPCSIVVTPETSLEKTIESLKLIMARLNAGAAHLNP